MPLIAPQYCSGTLQLPALAATFANALAAAVKSLVAVLLLEHRLDLDPYQD